MAHPAQTPSLGVATTPTVHSYVPEELGLPDPQGSEHPVPMQGSFWVAGQGPPGSCSSHLPAPTAPSSCSQQGPDTTATGCAISSGISPCTSFPENSSLPAQPRTLPRPCLTAGKAELWGNLLTHLMPRTV